MRFAALLALLLATLTVFAPVQARAETAAERSVLLVRQGAAALLRGRFGRAIKAYDEALQYDKLAPIRRASILSDRGVAHWRMQKNEQAVADFNQAIEINDKYPQAYNNLGNVLVDMNKHKEAIEAYSKAIDLAPTYGVAYNNRGSAYFELGDIEAAVSDFSSAIRHLSLNAVPHNGRGRALLTKKLYYAALRDFNRAVRLNKTYGMVFLSRARALAKVGRFSEAVKDYTRAIAIARNEPQLYLERGRSYQAINHYGPAISDYSKVIDLAPGHAEAYSRRGLCFSFSRNSKKALSDVDKAIELDPTSYEGYLARAKVLKRMGNFESAKGDISTVLEISKENAEALKLLGQMHEVKDEKELAKGFYERSLASDPFMDGSREGLRRITRELPSYAGEIIGERVSGWGLSKTKDGRYYVTHEGYPFFHAFLETYGEGEPKLLEWSPMTGKWKRIGLLRYAAGKKVAHITPKNTANETDKNQTRFDVEAAGEPGERMVYAAIIDLKKARLAALEPVSWGEKLAKWKWGNGVVSITDPDGMVSEVQLRKPVVLARQRTSSRGKRRGGFYAPSPWGDIFQPSRRRASSSRSRSKKRSSRRRRKNKKSLLDWLFQ